MNEQMRLIEQANEETEMLIADLGCPAHDDLVFMVGGTCLLCEADAAQQAVRAHEALWALQAVMAPQQWPDESEAEWVRRAKANLLPAKVVA